MSWKVKAIGLFLFLFVSGSCFGDKLEKAFERLRLFDYFKAKELFEESLEKKTADRPERSSKTSWVSSTNNDRLWLARVTNTGTR